jgi:hypothetical protein
MLALPVVTVELEGGHARQMSGEVAPNARPYLPISQSTHGELPDVFFQLPTQALHSCPSPPEYPTLQVQAAAERLRVGESEFAGQVRQLVALFSEYVPAPHERHVCCVVAPSDAEYFPAGQAVHSSGQGLPSFVLLA